MVQDSSTIVAVCICGSSSWGKKTCSERNRSFCATVIDNNEPTFNTLFNNFSCSCRNIEKLPREDWHLPPPITSLCPPGILQVKSPVQRLRTHQFYHQFFFCSITGNMVERVAKVEWILYSFIGCGCSPIWRAPKWKDGNTRLYQIAKHVNIKLDTFRNVAISILVRLKHCSILLIDVYLLPTKTQSQYTETWQGHAIGSNLYTSTGCFSRRFLLKRNF